VYVRASLVLFVARFAFAQPAPTPPAFEVASAKVSQTRGKASVESTPGGVTIDGTLAYIVGWAYDLKRYQVSGPDWLTSERYHIAAKPASPAPIKDLKLMLQTLLAERFKLTSHRETKELAVYALTVAKGGPKLKPSDSEGEPVTVNNKKLGSGGTSLRTSMAQFADLLDGGLGPDPIVDLTGLKGRYDFSLDISSYMPGMQNGDLPVFLNDALQRQLGLNLKPRKVPIAILVVDHAEKVPLEN
jgi:uncharacterized protein (TIGR03435 family)